MRTVMIAGGFDPLHSGHIDHIRKAAVLGDRLIIVLQSDANLIAKKGYAFMPYMERKGILQALHWTAEVVPNVDSDGTVCASLELYLPDIYAKGGDRTRDNMPASELDTCARLGIEIRYCVGDLLGSSQGIVRSFMKRHLASPGPEMLGSNERCPRCGRIDKGKGLMT